MPSTYTDIHISLCYCILKEEFPLKKTTLYAVKMVLTEKRSVLLMFTAVILAFVEPHCQGKYLCEYGCVFLFHFPLTE